MSTLTATIPTATAPVTPRPRPRPLRLRTLTDVEVRKMTDTRGSRALLAGLVALAVGILAWKVTHDSVEISIRNYSWAVTSAVGFILPVLGLLALSSEWTQRTALSTFTLAPRRGPVLAAKALAALLVGLAVYAAGFVLSVGATALAGQLHGGADLGTWATELRGGATFVVLQVLMGVAFGALTAQTAVALGLYLGLPTVWASAAPSVLGDAAPWFDVFGAYERLTSSHPFEHGAQTATAVGLWVLLPCVIGVWRALGREVK